ncbi:MAG TPA: hypothetical protein VFA18_12245, partial [Gemmataceae bacterium]|nr:hypothetical protein [Gemmataceae bacterium]
HSALRAATEFLQEYLKDGPKLSHDCTMAALMEGISEVTLRRAKEALGVRSVHDGKTLCWRWQLPRKA